MIPCPACHRHVRATDSICPFCTSPLRTTSAPHAPMVATMALALLGFACKSSGDDEGQDEAHETTSSGSESESTESAGTSESTESTESTESAGTETSTDTTESSGGSFYAGPDPDLPPDGAEPEVLYDGPQPHLPDHGARFRFPN